MLLIFFYGGTDLSGPRKTHPAPENVSPLNRGSSFHHRRYRRLSLYLQSLMESVQLAHAETAYTKAVDLFSQLTAPRFDGKHVEGASGIYIR